ncbi:hypothetical protein [Granulicella aggregans]|uniref:hypothetical protein n=1 Tax=Granulicella aggregans TaxID=474949 RepID=UPI0021E010F4|nr:hypothetical protein [Granulicella aggregans]
MAYNSATGDISFANVSPRGVVTVWQRAWIKGFTHLMPFNMDSQNYLLTYSSVTGAVQYSPIAANLPGPPSSPGDWSGPWGPGFTNFMPFTIQNEPHFLAYNTSTGLVHLDRIAANLEGSANRFEATWGLVDSLPLYDVRGSTSLHRL